MGGVRVRERQCSDGSLVSRETERLKEEALFHLYMYNVAPPTLSYLVRGVAHVPPKPHLLSPRPSSAGKNSATSVRANCTRCGGPAGRRNRGYVPPLHVFEVAAARA